MKVRKGQEYRRTTTQRVVAVVEGLVVVEDVETGQRSLANLGAAGGLEGYDLVAHGTVGQAAPETPATLRKMPPGSVRGPTVMMDAVSAAALAFGLAWLRAHPHETLPANNSGLVCLALREFAAARGWNGGKT